MEKDVSVDSGETQGARELVGKKAPDFSLKDQSGNSFHLYTALDQGPVLLVFYPRDFSMVCTKQLCSYRDVFPDFSGLGVQLVGISRNPSEAHTRYVEQYKFPFPLLSDPDNKVARAYGCSSMFMMGAVSRAIAIVSRQKILLYRYVEPTVLTHRKAEELLAILRDLKANDLL